MNASVAHVRISENKKETEDDESNSDDEWLVELDIEVGSVDCGFLVVTRRDEVSLSCWVPDQLLSKKFQNQEHSLRANLREFNLVLKSFIVLPQKKDVSRVGSPHMNPFSGAGLNHYV